MSSCPSNDRGESRIGTGLDDGKIRKLPKVLLHDHLDGGLRPQTIIDLAQEVEYRDLPSLDPRELEAWFVESANSGTLDLYLETFRHTVAVMQTVSALRRVASECVEDLAVDGVVYAEVRFAPELHLMRGLKMEDAIESVIGGFREGEKRMADRGVRIRVGLLLSAMRTESESLDVAKLVVKYRDEGVVGFDIAGAEAGYPPTEHLPAFEYLRGENARFTIHAGEGFGLPSIWEALQLCGADRLGHGVRIVDDIANIADGSPNLGRLAAYVRDKRIPLELCPSSNVQTGAAASISEHPIGLLRSLGFRVTVNTDNRLMSGTSMSREFSLLRDAFGFTESDFEWLTINAMKSAFLPFDQRLAIINGQIKPGYLNLRD